MAQRFAGRVVLVTGGGTGIGRESARAFAAEGARVVVAGRTAESLAETVRLITDDGGKADHVPADVTVGEQVARLVSTVVDRHGQLDVAFNNAGAGPVPGNLAELDEGGWEAGLANVTGTWLSMRHEIPHMRANGGGVIVNMSSTIGANMTIPGLGAYAAGKAAISNLTRTTAKEYIADGIRINAVSPGPVDTHMSRLPGETDEERSVRMKSALPAGRVGTTREIAAGVLWLASPEAGFVVGHDLALDGGAAA